MNKNRQSTPKRTLCTLQRACKITKKPCTSIITIFYDLFICPHLLSWYMLILSFTFPNTVNSYILKLIPSWDGTCSHAWGLVPTGLPGYEWALGQMPWTVEVSLWGECFQGNLFHIPQDSVTKQVGHQGAGFWGLQSRTSARSLKDGLPPFPAIFL